MMLNKLARLWVFMFMSALLITVTSLISGNLWVASISGGLFACLYTIRKKVYKQMVYTSTVIHYSTLMGVYVLGLLYIFALFSGNHLAQLCTLPVLYTTLYLFTSNVKSDLHQPDEADKNKSQKA
jgi:hypothetical protein